MEAKKPEGCDADATVIQRTIEFHPARKFFSPSSNGAFYLETLNPDSETPRPSPCNRDPPAVSAPSLGRRSDGVEAYEHEIDPELSSRIRFRNIVSAVFGILPIRDSEVVDLVILGSVFLDCMVPTA